MKTFKENLKSAHENLWNACESIPDPYRNRGENEKWSPVQHVQHINKGIGAFYKFLQMDKAAIAQTFGFSERVSRSYDETMHSYVQRVTHGAVSTPQFIPDTSDTISFETEKEKGSHIVEGMVTALSNWNDDELDRYVCPHPLLGRLTVREMFYFMIFHAQHHSNSLKKIKESLKLEIIHN